MDDCKFHFSFCNYVIKFSMTSRMLSVSNIIVISFESLLYQLVLFQIEMI